MLLCNGWEMPHVETEIIYIKVQLGIANSGWVIQLYMDIHASMVIYIIIEKAFH